MRTKRLCLLMAAGFWLLASGAFPQSAPAPYDIVIRNGRIMDGTGSPWYSGDIGIRGGRIAAIGNLAAAETRRVIDARGMVVAPGFIDMLGQSELTVLVNPHLPSKIFQGITTEITGEGGSAAPLNDAIIQADQVTYKHFQIRPDWRTFREYFARLEKQGMGINLASYVGATQVRRMVLGDDNRAPSPAELERMRSLVREAMKDGTVGLSTSLQYAPAPYATTEELIALASEAAKLGGIYASHMRSEGDAIIGALDEAIRIGREAKIPVEIWHLKAAGKRNWGRMPEIVAHIERARQSGVDIAADTYAYPAGYNSFSAFIPPWAHDGGDAKLIERLKDPAMRARIRKDMETPSAEWDNEWQEIPGPEAILIGAVENPKLMALQGKTVAEIAKLWNKDPIDTIFDFLIEDRAYTNVAVFAMSEADVSLALMQPWVSINNDSQGTSPDGLLGKEHPHPRAYGTFPRILRKYVREEKKLRLEEAIRKFTALAAQRVRLTDRGVLKAGMWADIVVFDPSTVRDFATFEKPNQLSDGMQYVLVNGVPAIDGGKATNALPGKVLRGQGYENPRKLAVSQLDKMKREYAWIARHTLGQDLPTDAAEAVKVAPANFAELAKTIVDSLEVQKGERVMMHMDPTYYPELADELRQALYHKGAVQVGTTLADTPAFEKARGKESPEYLARQAELFKKMLAETDIFLWLPMRAGRGVPIEKLMDEAKWKGRAIHFHWVAQPFLERGPEVVAWLSGLYEEALKADPKTLGATQDRLIAALRAGRARLTTAAGTDLTFEVRDRPFHRNDGIATRERAALADRTGSLRDREFELPAGALRVIPVEDSWEGTLALPKFPYGNRVLSNVKLVFKNGRITEESARANPEFYALWSKETGDRDRVGELVLGTNPTLAPVDDDILPYYGYGSGVVRIALGDNWESGGRNRSSFAPWLFLTGATLEVGGRTLLRQGKLE